MPVLPASTPCIMDSVYRPPSRPASAEDAIRPFGGIVEKRQDPQTKSIPPPPFNPIGQGPSATATESQWLSEDEKSYKDSSREWVPCIRCKEFSFDCHGPEIKLGGYCSYCHLDRKRCKWESRTSDLGPNVTFISPNRRLFAVSDGTLLAKVLPSNDESTDINIANTQLYTLSSSSSSQQWYQEAPIVDGSCDQESSNKIGDFADNQSIPGAPGIGHGGKDRPPGKRDVESATGGHKDDVL